MNSLEEYQNLIALLEKALEFYADKSNYRYPDFSTPQLQSRAELDGGSQARFALSKSKETIENVRKLQEDYDNLMADPEELIKAYKILDNDNNNI